LLRSIPGREDGLHEPSATCNHDVLNIRQGLKPGGANEHGRFFPDAIVLEEAVCVAESFGTDPGVSGRELIYAVFYCRDSNSPFVTPFAGATPRVTVMVGGGARYGGFAFGHSCM